MQGLCLMFLLRREVRCHGGPLPSADISTQQFEQFDLFVDDSYFWVGSLCLYALLASRVFESRTACPRMGFV